jgi:hypothetical protein
MKKILVTGGPVHAHLDFVKIITNRFKGGRMAELANELGQDLVRKNKTQVTYLCSKDSVQPKQFVKVVHHNGFNDYRQKVLELAPKMDAVILGAAVCNLIPVKPWDGKFPSHNYSVGETIPIDFTIAPRVVDEVKKVAPRTKLFAFKLLQGVEHEELIEAAYDIVLESSAVAVFANDADDLNTKYAVTKERTVLKFGYEKYSDWVKFILDAVEDEYYSTVTGLPDFGVLDYRHARKIMKKLNKKYQHKFEKQYGKQKYRFGTIAVRVADDNAFVTTARGKKEMDELAMVEKVDNRKRVVYASEKVTLNAPLLYNLFKNHPQVKAIVHYHGEGKFPETANIFKYAPPGTKRDSMRELPWYPKYKNSRKGQLSGIGTGFTIEGHGSFELLTEEEVNDI